MPQSDKPATSKRVAPKKDASRPAKSIQKNVNPKTDAALDMSPLADFALRPTDWNAAVILKSVRVLGKLRRHDPLPHKAVTSIMTESECEEAAAYWNQLDLTAQACALTSVVASQAQSEEAKT